MQARKRKRGNANVRTAPAPLPAAASERSPVKVTTIAQRLGVSVSTVSFVLNGHAKKYGIADRTAARILKLAQELNYVPNELARRFRSQRSGIIGLVMPHFRNDWADRVLEGMYPLLDREQLLPFLVNHRMSGEQEARELETLFRQRVEGIILKPVPDGAERYRMVLERQIPLVFIGETLDELPEVSFAAWDPRVVERAIQHLVDTGCRRIGYLGFGDNRRMARSAYECYLQTLRRNGIDVDPRWVVLNQRGEPFKAVLQEMFAPARADRERPDGLFAPYNDTARTAVDVLEAAGIRIPDDVSVATWGDSPLAGSKAYDLTRVSTPVPDEGREAVRVLLELIANPQQPPIHRILEGGTLILGRSTRH